MDNSKQVAAALNNGINISLLEIVKNGQVHSPKSELKRSLKECAGLGFSSIRLPLAFDAWLNPDGISFRKAFYQRLDLAVNMAVQHKFRLIFCYHRGQLNNNNYEQEGLRIARLWSLVAKRYAALGNDILLFEPYNEPVMDEWRWTHCFRQISDSIRQWNTSRILVYGATNYNSIYELSRLQALPLKNIIYTFHFYEPFLFTHQGAEWAGEQCATTGLPFPFHPQVPLPPLHPKAKNTWGEYKYYEYKNEASDSAIYHKLRIVYEWSRQQEVALFCGEFGSYARFADEESRCRYAETVVRALSDYRIPYLCWDYNREFGIVKKKKVMPCYMHLFKLKKN